MKTLKMFFTFTVIFSFIFLAGCKKDNDTTPQDNPNAFDLKTLDIPDAMSQSSDPGARKAAEYMILVNSLQNFNAMMVPPKSAPAQDFKGGNDPIVYHWDCHNGEDGDYDYSVTLTITETDALYNWKMKITGVLHGHDVDNFLFIEAGQYKDGHDNYFIVYDWEKPKIPGFVLHWHTTNDVDYLTYEVPETIYVSFSINADNSGSVVAKDWADEEYHQTYTATWDPSGHGEYWEYDLNGELIDHGNW